MPAAECFYARNNQQQGPVTWEALQAMAGAGQLQRGDLVWRPGMGNWQPAGELAALFPAAPVAPAAPFSPPAPFAAPASFAASARAAQSAWQGPSLGGVAPPPPNSGYAPSPLGYAGYDHAAPSQRTTAIWAFVCSIIGLFVCAIVFEVIAVFQSTTALQAMRANGNEEGKGLAIAARVIGIVGLILWGANMVLRFGRTAGRY